MTAEKRTITPDEAKKMLGFNPNNRNIKNAKVKAWARAMQEGKWELNGETIKIALDGALIDGQNRLTACVLAEVPFTTYVITGLPNGVQSTVDGGTSRTFADTLQIEGRSNASGLAALARNVHLWKGDGFYKNATNQYELKRTLESISNAEHIVRFSKRVTTKINISPSVAGFIYWLLQEAGGSMEDIEFFMERANDGQGLVEGDPIYALRKRLDALPRAEGGHDGSSLRVAYVIKAWNAYILGRPVKVLTYAPGGSRPEPFPIPIGSL